MNYPILITVVVLVLIFIPISRLIVMIKRRYELLEDEMPGRIVQMGESIIISPERGSYRGAAKDYGKIKSDGMIALTNKRIYFEKVLGGTVEIERSLIKDTSLEKWFLGSYKGGMTHLVIHLENGNQIGFFVKDHEHWLAKLNLK